MKNKSLVFLSCGQRDDERVIAKQIEALINGSKPLTMSVVGRGGGGPTPTAN